MSGADTQGVSAWPPGSNPVSGHRAPAEPSSHHLGPQRLSASWPHGDLPMFSFGASIMLPQDPQPDFRGVERAVTEGASGCEESKARSNHHTLSIRHTLSASQGMWKCLLRSWRLEQGRGYCSQSPCEESLPTQRQEDSSFPIQASILSQEAKERQAEDSCQLLDKTAHALSCTLLRFLFFSPITTATSLSGTLQYAPCRYSQQQ